MLNAHATFDAFVVGSSNRLAVTASKAVAESPGAAYNPLFIYARPGLGKTHLLMAIGHEARRVDQGRTIEYVTVDDFVEAYQAALAAGQAEAYRRRFIGADLVLIDDAQLLADRRELQSELLRLIDQLMAADRQIVLAGDRPPEEIQQLDERLIRRFGGGLVIDIAAPDYETRLAILGRRARDRHIDLPAETLAMVAELPIGTVRELIGALNRLAAQQAVQTERLEVGQARRLLEALGHRVPEQNAGKVRAEAVAVPEVTVERDEFGDFLSDLTASVARRVDSWRQRITEASLRWSAEGFRTGRLDAALSGDLPDDPEEILQGFERDVAALRGLQQELAVAAPELLSEALLYDPDRLANAIELVADAREAGAPPPGPSPRYHLDSFSVGASTRSAVAAIHAAAAAPGSRYNPVVLVGRSGEGKTHLLHAFGLALQEQGLRRVAVMDGRTFVADLVTALGDGTVTRWRHRLRRVDALLIDDVDSLAGKDRSQEELYLLYNILVESGRQMAFTCSVPPAQQAGLEPRLATRLGAGLVVSLGPPDREARITEVERLLGDAALDPELVDYLAGRPAASIRELQQLVNRVAAAADERGLPLSLAVARRILEGATVADQRPPRRGSGLVAPGGGALRSREKMIETWPTPSERLIGEWR